MESLSLEQSSHASLGMAGAVIVTFVMPKLPFPSETMYLVRKASRHAHPRCMHSLQPLQTLVFICFSKYSASITCIFLQISVVFKSFLNKFEGDSTGLGPDLLQWARTFYMNAICMEYLIAHDPQTKCA